MKKIIHIIITVAIFGLCSFRQTQSDCSFPNQLTLREQQERYTKSQIEQYIREIFGERSDELVFNSTSGRLELITGFLTRVSVANKPEYTGKKFPLLSELKLQNKYNKLLRRDEGVNFQASNFNPLKYDFPKISKTKMIYRIDDTDYLIIINPAR